MEIVVSDEAYKLLSITPAVGNVFTAWCGWRVRGGPGLRYGRRRTVRGLQIGSAAFALSPL